MDNSKPIPRIKKVKAEFPRVLVSWKGGGQATADLTGWIATGRDFLAPLSSPKFFATARPNDYGSAVTWGDEDSDLAIDAVHLEAIAEEQLPFGSASLSNWQKHVGLSNREAADFLDVSLSTFNAYKAGAKVPAVVGMVCRACGRDTTLLHAHYRPRKTGRPRTKPVGAIIADIQDALSSAEGSAAGRAAARRRLAGQRS